MASVTRDRESCGCGTSCFRVHMCMHVCTYLFPFMCVAHSRVCRVCGEARGQPWVSFHRGHLTFFNKIFEDLFNYFMCLHVLLACMYAFLMRGTHREQTASGSQGLALQLWDIIWVLGIDVRASARATSTLTHGVNSPASKFIFDTLAWSPPIQARLAVQWAPEIYLSLSPTLELQGTVSRFSSGCVYLPSLLSVVLKHSLSKTDKY